MHTTTIGSDTMTLSKSEQRVILATLRNRLVEVTEVAETARKRGHDSAHRHFNMCANDLAELIAKFSANFS